MNDKPIYAAVFTPHMKGTLGRDISDQHVTLAFAPDEAKLYEILQHSDKPIEIEITGYGNDGKNEGLLVKILDDKLPYFGAPNVHITLSVSEDSTPIKTGDLVFDKEIPNHIPKKIYGTLGTFTAQKGVVFDKEYVENNCFDELEKFSNRDEFDVFNVSEYDNEYEQQEDELPEPNENGFIIDENEVLLKYVGNDENVVIPDGVTKIIDNVFYDCEFITNVTIPDSVTSIGNKVFYGCISLTNVTIGNGVTNIGEMAFGYCSSLNSVYINDLTSWYNIDFADSCATPLFYSDLYLNGKQVTNLVIPEGITEIKDYAFIGCTSLTSVTIPDNVASIGDGAFKDCPSLTNVTIGNGVTSIGEDAFYNCSSLTSITIGNSVTSIGNYTFKKCISLKSVTIPDSVTSIGNYAFKGCASLTSVTIGDGITSIGDGVFKDCASLTNVTIPKSVELIGAETFVYCKSLESVTFEGNPKLGANIFFCCCPKEIIVRNEEMKQYLIENVDLSKGCEIKVVEKELDKEDEITNIGEIGTDIPTNADIGNVCKEIMDSNEEFVYDEVPDDKLVTSK